MKHEIEKALKTISVPDDISVSVRMGVRQVQNERKGTVMTRSVKKIATIAAALVLCVGIVGAASLIGLKKDTKTILTADDISLKFNGFNSNGTLNLSAEYNDTGKPVDGAVNLSNYTIVDENGAVVATCDGDKVRYEQMGLVYYWADENGKLYFTSIYSGTYKVVVKPDYTATTTEIDGEWTIDVDLEELNYQVFFDPRTGYQGSVEDGTAYVADDEIKVEFVNVEEPISMPKITMDPDGNLYEDHVDVKLGDKVLKIAVNSDDAPYNDIKEIGVSAYIIFDENRMYAGGAGSVSLAPEVKRGFGSEYFSWGSVYHNGGDLYVVNNGEDQGRLCTVKIYSFIVELSDGSRVEIQGDWMVDFTV